MSYSWSQRFAQELKYSHRIATKVELWADGNYVQELVVTDGNIRISSKEIRRRAELTVLNPSFDLVPENMLDKLAPAGNEIHLYRGLLLSTGEEELMPLGVYTIDDVRVDESGNGHQLRLDCFDYGRRVQRARFVNDYTIDAGTLVVDAIQTMVSEAIPNVQFDVEGTISDATPARFYEAGKDRWAAVQSLALNIGAEVFFDGHGHCVIRYVDTNTHAVAPVWEFDVESPTNTLMYINKRLHNSDTYNHVIVSGESTATGKPIRAEAADLNPASPTYVFGKYGRVTYHHQSSQITTVEQAQQVAAALLQKGLGATESIDLTNVVHPGLDIGDAIYVNVPKTKTRAIYQIDSITIPMIAIRGMNIGCRERLVA